MLFQLFVDEVISEVNVGGILLGVAIINLLDASPIDGAEAHGARLAGSIDDAI